MAAGKALSRWNDQCSNQQPFLQPCLRWCGAKARICNPRGRTVVGDEATEGSQNRRMEETVYGKTKNKKEGREKEEEKKIVSRG